MNSSMTRPNPVSLPQFVRDLISSPPQAGAGVHNWLFRCARVLHPYRNPAEIEEILAASTHGCGRQVPISEIRSAVANSHDVAWKPSAPGGQHPPRVGGPRWPAVDNAKRASVTGTGFTLVELWQASPVRLGKADMDAEQAIDALFPEDALLCVGIDSRHPQTKSRKALRGQLGRLQFIVPSPMTAAEGRTKAGRLSSCSLNNTGPRRSLVVEFDSGSIDEHAGIIAHLSEQGPLVMVVHLGNKSLHAWFSTVGQPDDRVLNFFRYAVSLGADPATWSICQFVRMPEGRRDNGVRQVVWFLNPGCSDENRPEGSRNNKMIAKAGLST